MSQSNIDPSWTLFLDRDGVINRRIVDGYVTKPTEFEFLPGVLESLVELRNKFKYLIVVSNQQGVGKKLMTLEDVDRVHLYLLDQVKQAGGDIDAIYFAPQLAKEGSSMRKPNPGMALKAKEQYPDIQFDRSVMVGDMITDMLFGKNLGMTTVLISEDPAAVFDSTQNAPSFIDHTFPNLSAFTNSL